MKKIHFIFRKKEKLFEKNSRKNYFDPKLKNWIGYILYQLLIICYLNKNNRYKEGCFDRHTDIKKGEKRLAKQKAKIRRLDLFES